MTVGYSMCSTLTLYSTEQILSFTLMMLVMIEECVFIDPVKPCFMSCHTQAIHCSPY